MGDVGNCLLGLVHFRRVCNSICCCTWSGSIMPNKLQICCDCFSCCGCTALCRPQATDNL
uniref:Uncharacterized protein n=1 Tax=Arundo donax TaxID=35708 RepID=A0A0A9G139_ARUDO